MCLDSFVNTKNIDATWTESNSIVSTIQKSFTNSVTQLVNNLTQGKK